MWVAMLSRVVKEQINFKDFYFIYEYTLFYYLPFYFYHSFINFLYF